MWSRIRKKLLLLTLFLTILVAAVSLYVDRRVSKALASNRMAVHAGLYFATPRLNSGFMLSAEEFEQWLIARRYQKVSGKPANPGSFSQKGPQFEVITRPFPSSHGGLISSRSYKVNTSSGEIRDSLTLSESSLTLEPLQLTKLGSSSRKASHYTPLKKIPELLQKTVLAVEDQRFYSHFGVDPLGIARALVENLKARRVVQGGSTLTQQYAKNLLFSPKRTITRKILEALAAVSLELRLSKDQILERYLNEVYLGQQGAVAIHGFPEASRALLGKPLDALSADQIALLAGLIRAPSAYAPHRHPERARTRRNTVLQLMVEQKLISNDERKELSKQKLQLAKAKSYQKLAPHFTDSLIRQLEKNYDVDITGLSKLRINTTLIPELQSCASSAVTTGAENIIRNYPALKSQANNLEVGLVAIEPYSGKIRAWVGSRSYSNRQFDHVVQAKRQIGSTIKPFLYLTALDKNLNDYKVATPITILPDRPIEIESVAEGGWEPRNYDRKHRGDVTLRYALEKSLNIPAAYVGQRIGISALGRTIERFNLAESPPLVPALALGAVDTTLLELTNGYAALANGGIYVQPRMFVSITSSEGEIGLKPVIAEERVADESAVFVLTNILQGVVERGTGTVVRRLGYKFPVAGKTGTSSDARDAWFVGYEPALAAGVWVGLADNSKLGLTGASGAAPIWASFMKCAAKYRAPLPFVAPRDVLYVEVDSVTGERASHACGMNRAVQEIFVRGTEPFRYCLGDGKRRYEEIPPPADLKRRRAPSPKRKKRSLWDALFG